MAIWLQHLLVISLAIGCAAAFALRRLRALSGRAPACDGCAGDHPCGGAKGGPALGTDVPIPASALVRRGRREAEA